MGSKDAVCVQTCLPISPLTEWLEYVAQKLPLGPSLHLQRVRADSLLPDAGTGKTKMIMGAADVLMRPRVATLLGHPVGGEPSSMDVCINGQRVHVLGMWRALLSPLLLRGEDARASSSSSRFSSMHVDADGQGRRLLCVLAALHTLVGSSRSLHHLFDMAGCATSSYIARFPVLWADHVGGEEASRGWSPNAAATRQRHRVRLVQLMRRMAMIDGLRLGATSPTTRTTEEEEEVVPEDWLSFVASEAWRELHLCGDAWALYHDDGIQACPITYVTGIIHHLLAAEVEGETLHTLRQLLVSYLHPDRPSNKMMMSSPCMWEDLEQRLRWLLHHPSEVLMLPHLHGADGAIKTTTDVSPTTAPLHAAVRASRTVDARVFVLPRLDAREDVAHLPQVSPPFPCFERGAKVAEGQDLLSPLPSSSSSCDDDDDDDGATRVAFLRVDPSGGWLSAVEDAHNTRTFLPFYSNDAHHQRAAASARRPAWRPPNSSSEEDEEDVRLYHSNTHQRTVLRHGNDGDVQAQRHVDPSSSSSPDDVLELAVVAVLRQLAIAPHAEDDVVLRGTIRLCTWAVLHGVEVLLSPERVPSVLQSFAQRHITSLRATLIAEYAAGRLTLNADAWANLTSTRSSSSSLCGIYVVDQLHPGCLRRLQNAVKGSSMVWCRDTLRMYSAAGDAITVDVRRCCVCRSTELLHLPHEAVGRQPYLGRRCCVVKVRGGDDGHDAANKKHVGGAPRLVLLLLTPSVALTNLYEGLLLKVARTLLGVLHDEWRCTPEVMRDEVRPQQQQQQQQPRGCIVRAGGVFGVAVAQHLARLASDVAHARCRVVGSSDLPMLATAMMILAAAALAPANAIAQSVMADGSPLAALLATHIGHPPAGPRSRQKAWRASVVDALQHQPSQSSSCAMAVHLYRCSVEEEVSLRRDDAELSRLRDELRPTNTSWAGWPSTNYAFVEPISGYTGALRSTATALATILSAAR